MTIRNLIRTLVVTSGLMLAGAGSFIWLAESAR